MAKGYLVDETQQCIIFALPGARRITRCAISFATLAEHFGTAQFSATENFLENRSVIQRVAAELISAGRSPNGDGWIWLGGADLQSAGTPSQGNVREISTNSNPTTHSRISS